MRPRASAIEAPSGAAAWAAGTSATAPAVVSRPRGGPAPASWRIAVTLAALSTTLGAGLLGCSTPGDDPGPPLPVDPAALYAQMCARCHGADGRGDPEIRKTLPVRNFSDPAFQARANVEEISRVIMAGKNQMPAFGAMLSPPKIQSLSGYVRRLGRGAATAVVPPAPAASPPSGGSGAPAATGGGAAAPPTGTPPTNAAP